MSLSVQVEGPVQKISHGALCHVSIHLPVVDWFKDIIVSRTVIVAGTSLDKHHALLDDFTIRALEFHRESGCSVGGATTPIGADATKFGSVGLYTGTARQLKLDRLRDLRCTDAFFTFLLGGKKNLILHQINKCFHSDHQRMRYFQHLHF